MFHLHSRVRGAGVLIFCFAMIVSPALAEKQSYTKREQGILAQLKELRPMPEGASRSALTRDLAMEIRNLPLTPGKVRLAAVLGMFVTEVDGSGELQEVVDTISAAIQQAESKRKDQELPYSLLAILVRYRGAQTPVTSAGYLSAMSELEQADRVAEGLDFTLVDLQGTEWKLSALKGKVVLVNFWATWCPPCVKEIATLKAAHEELKDKGVVILGVSEDENETKLRDFVWGYQVRYPILRDVGGRILKAQKLEALPQTLIYNRDGKFVRRIVDAVSRETLWKTLSDAGVQ